MTGLAKLVAVILATLLGLVIFTQYEADSLTSVTRVGGIPVIAIAQSSPRGLIAIGQVGANGVIVIGQLGYGVIAFTQLGAGLLFGLGQVVAGLVVIAQGFVGLFFFLGQVGVGMQAIGQGVYKKRGSEHFKEMSEEFNALLSFRST